MSNKNTVSRVDLRKAVVTLKGALQEYADESNWRVILLDDSDHYGKGDIMSDPMFEGGTNIAYWTLQAIEELLGN